MPLIHVVLILVLVGVGLYLLNRYVTMDGKIKQIINWVVVIAVVLWLLNVFGVIGSVNTIRVGP